MGRTNPSLIDTVGEPEEIASPFLDHLRTKLHLESRPTAVAGLDYGIDLKPSVLPVVIVRNGNDRRTAYPGILLNNRSNDQNASAYITAPRRNGAPGNSIGALGEVK